MSRFPLPSCLSTPTSFPVRLATATLVLAGILVSAPGSARGDCPADTLIQNYTGSSFVPCPCFVPGEEAGSVLTPPPEHYPLKVTKVGIAWGSQFGGQPNSFEQAVRLYNGGLPDPGIPVYELLGPVLVDGAINQFTLAPVADETTIASGPITVTLEFLNQNAGNTFAPTVVYDTDGCQFGKNVVNASPGGWADACQLGVTGDWVFFIIYEPCVGSQTGIGDGPQIAATAPVMILPASPNPFRGATDFEFLLTEAGQASIRVFDTAGRQVATLADRHYEAGVHRERWAPETALRSGIYFVELRSRGHRSVGKIVLAK